MIFNQEGVRNIWVAIDPDFKEQRIINFIKDDGQDIGALLFKETSNEIIFIRGGAPNRRGEIPNPTGHIDGAKRLLLSISENGGAINTLSEGSIFLNRISLKRLTRDSSSTLIE